MFSSLLLSSDDSVIADRMTRLQDSLRALSLSTREEYQAAVYSLVNRVLNLGDNMQSLVQVAPRPAIVGDLTQNLTLLNQDAGDIAAEMLRVEDNAAALYNLAATSQNSLRQLIRTAIYASNPKLFVEAFIDDSALAASYTTTLDYNAGLATLPLGVETQVTPTIAIGLGSVGTAGTPVSNLSAGTVGSSLQWNGTVLELVLSFSGPTIINRLALALDEYEGLEITELTSSPDGLSTDDVLKDLGVSSIIMDATSGKYSGDVILDFPPRYVTQMKIVIESRAGQAAFGIRSLSLFNRTYQISGTFTTQPITLSTGNALFSIDANTFDPYTSIAHQISTDGVNFNAIEPGQVSISTPFWYKALLTRNEKAFTQQQSALLLQTSNGAVNAFYTVKSQTTNTLNSGLIEQTVTLSGITGPVPFRSTPLPKTFRVQVGSTYLNPGTDYTLANNVLSFAAPQALATITFQTSSLGSAALASMKNYYTPLLYGVRFQAI